jgi:hypothetical protein
MGEVYRARDMCLDRIVAIKVSEHVDARRLEHCSRGQSAKLLDFGLAKITSARETTETLLTAAGVLSGTLRYMARTA